MKKADRKTDGNLFARKH